MKKTDITGFKNVWFTSDTHFGDERLNLFGRTNVFNNAREADQAIVNNWNKTVGKDDLIIHLGDVALSDAGLNLVKQLNGTKWLIKGNYDEPETSACSVDGLSLYFEKIESEMYVEIENEIVYLNHYPSKCKVDHFNLTGHIHGLWKVQRNMINVGCDAWHFLPIHLDMIKFNMTAIRKYYDINVFAGELKSNLEYGNI